jgi:hypothetical protein
VELADELAAYPLREKAVTLFGFDVYKSGVEEGVTFVPRGEAFCKPLPCGEFDVRSCQKE